MCKLFFLDYNFYSLKKKKKRDPIIQDNEIIIKPRYHDMPMLISRKIEDPSANKNPL